jgi:TRAP-type C4-dicarboxylate transport system substrate-binding protein
MKIKNKFFYVLVFFVSFIAIPQNSFAGKSNRIKIATLAPEGSTWMQTLRKLDKELKKETGGELSFKFYPGGVSGDEKDVIRKMRIGQVHAAGFTGVGLGEILPESRVLDLPFLFESDQEVEHVYAKLQGHFAEKFEQKGYVLLGWVPIGWVHFFSKKEIVSIDDLRKTKAWMWEGDPLVQAAYKTLSVSPFPLSITDVLLSLQTGMIETVYASPVAALALQWFTKIKYMSQTPMGFGVGGILISKRKYKKLSEDQQKILKKLSGKFLKKLVHENNKDNVKSIQAMQGAGLKLAKKPDEKTIKEFRHLGKKVQEALVGKLFSADLLKKVTDSIQEVRK